MGSWSRGFTVEGSRTWRRLAAGLLSALFAMGGSLVAVPSVAAAETPRIMVVGDSISQGSAGDFTWRYRLYKHLVGAGVTPDFVGPRNDLYDNVANQQGDLHYADTAFDRDHDAIWGRMLDDEKATIQSEVQASSPGYLLVLLGINDLAFGRSDPAGTEASLRTFIANARAANPNLRIVLGKLLPTQRASDDPAFASMVADYNARLVQAASQLSTSTSPIAVADDGRDVVPADDLYDGTHANARGEVRVAAGFADALSSSFALGSTYPRPYPDVPIGPQTPPQLSVTAGDGTATLTWTGSPGATGYYVLARETTLQTDFQQLPIPLALSNSPWTGGFIRGGHYEIKLRAVKGSAEGAYSNTATTTIAGATPAAPAGLTAVAGDNKITLSWTAGANASGYWVLVRNVTDGQTDFTQLPYPVAGTSWTGQFDNGATYDLKLQSLNGLIRGGESNTVRAAPTGAVPAGVTNLAATGGNGEATLRWTEVPSASGYSVWTRNVTGGETDLTKLPFPVFGGEWTGGLLENGATYEFRLQSVNGRIVGGFSNTVQVTPTVAPPAGPAGLTASAGNRVVALSWTEAANATGYSVWTRNVTAGETAFTQLPWPVPGSSWTAEQLTNGAIYEFKLQSVSGRIVGGFSNTVQATPTVAPPPGPANLTVTNGSKSARLAWTEAANATGYSVWTRNVTAGETAFSQLPYPVSGGDWTAEQLTNGATYEFKLQSVSGLIAGGFSSVVTARPTGPAPAAPANFTIQAGNRRAVLTWDMPDNATCVYVFTRNVSAGETSFAKLPYPVCDDSWTATQLTNGATYEFKVQAYNDLIPGGTTAAVSARPNAPPPPGPETLTVRGGNHKATLGWTQASGATGYYVWVRQLTPSDGGWVQLPYPVAGDNWVAGSLLNGASYQFRVQSLDGLNPGGFSNTVSVTPLGPTPQGPPNLAISGSWEGTATMRWSGSSTASAYLVFMAEGSGGYSQLPYPVLSSPWTAGLLVPGHTYHFKLLAVSDYQQGTFSNVATVTIPLPPAPTGLTAVQWGTYQARLAWKPVPGVDGYRIYMGLGSSIWDQPPMPALPLDVPGPTFIAGYLLEHGIRFFKVAAVKRGVAGPVSNVATMVPLMDNPMFFEAHAWMHGYQSNGDKHVYLSSTTRGRTDHGLVLIREFIAPNDAVLWDIGDRRSFTDAPLVSSRATMAWDTKTGEIGINVAQSCEQGLTCHDALPIVLGSSGAGDGTSVSNNYVAISVSPTTANFTWKLTQSQAAGYPVLSQHIDGSAVVDASAGPPGTYVSAPASVRLLLTIDKFPSNEAYQYPRYTDNGFPVAHELATCDQAGPGSLGLRYLSTPTYGQRTCGNW